MPRQDERKLCKFDHAPGLAKTFCDRMLTSDLFAVAKLLVGIHTYPTPSQNLLLFVLLSDTVFDTVFLSVVVILLLVEMSCFYVHISNGSLIISSVAMLVLIIMSFCITFIVVLGMMIGLLLSSWRRFFV